MDYWRYNYDKITTDMEYVDVASHLADGWEYDGKVYTYAYYHADNNGDDVNDERAPATIANLVVAHAGRPDDCRRAGRNLLHELSLGRHHPAPAEGFWLG